MFTKQDGLKMAVDMLVEIEGAGHNGKYALDDYKQDNILYRHIQALASDPSNVEALEGFCALLTDKIAIGADAESYNETMEQLKDLEKFGQLEAMTPEQIKSEFLNIKSKLDEMTIEEQYATFDNNVLITRRKQLEQKYEDLTGASLS